MGGVIALVEQLSNFLGTCNGPLVQDAATFNGLDDTVPHRSSAGGYSCEGRGGKGVKDPFRAGEGGYPHY